MVDPISLEVFKNLFVSICEEMGVALQRTAYSPNIKERRDFSCALFDPYGQMVAQAAHVPVHLGAMPASVKAAIDVHATTFGPGDVVILNDPYLGGTHLPDITMVSPIYVSNENGRVLVGYVAPSGLPSSFFARCIAACPWLVSAPIMPVTIACSTEALILSTTAGGMDS